MLSLSLSNLIQYAITAIMSLQFPKIVYILDDMKSTLCSLNVFKVLAGFFGMVKIDLCIVTSDLQNKLKYLLIYIKKFT